MTLILCCTKLKSNIANINAADKCNSILNTILNTFMYCNITLPNVLPQAPPPKCKSTTNK